MYCGTLIKRVQDLIYCIIWLDLESEIIKEGISIRQKTPEENPGFASSVPAFSGSGQVLTCSAKEGFSLSHMSHYNKISSCRFHKAKL